MTTLPAHRRMAAGRTWPSMYRPENYDPITHYHRTEWRATLVMAVLFVAVLVGVSAGLM